DQHLGGDSLSIGGLSGTPNGNIYQQDDGHLLYHPNPDFSGTDTFTYWAADEDGDFSMATVTIEVWEM
ncbi:MAG: cadherin-like domain-containing protein, partial [Hyphomicrobiales bacterium]